MRTYSTIFILPCQSLVGTVSLVDKCGFSCYDVLMLRRLVGGLVDVLYPKTCLACKKKITVSSIDNLVCRQCWGKIKKNLPPFCCRCGRHLEIDNSLKNICRPCLKEPLHFDRAFSPCIYEGTIKELIQAFKYKNKDYLGPTLSRLMADFIKEYELPMDIFDFIVPIPLHKARLREREFNQAQILSDYIAREFHKKTLNDNLSRHRPTRTQTELETEERLLNVRESFSLKDKSAIRGKNILLVDDVLTTGATVSEATRVLKEAGAQIVFVLTLAN